MTTTVDLLIRGGHLIDGSGAPGTDADVAIAGGRIVAIGEGASALVGRETAFLDASGMVVAPGFVDIHTHSDVSLLHDPRGESKVLQGVTTEVIGNCSFSPFPIEPARLELHRDHLARIGDDPITPTWTDLAGYAAELERRGTAINAAPLLGHGTLRVAVLGVDDRPPTDAELERMLDLADGAFAQGAFGFSTGLTHVPSAYGSSAEIEAVARVARRRGRIYATHARAVAGGAFAAIEEAVAVGRATGVRVEFSHLAINEPHLWGHAAEVLAIFERARAEGIDIAFDVYPYDASSSSLTQYLPPWVQEGGTEAMRERLRDAGTRERALVDLAAGWFGGIPWHWERIVISRTGPGGEASIGRSVEAIAQDEGRPPQVVMLELCERFGNEAECVLFYRTEADMLAFLTHPLGVMGSDGSAIPLDQGGDKPHPRHFGSFPRVLGRYVRELGALGLPEAVAKMSSRPAERIGLADRGRAAPGSAADLVIFDADRVIDQATFLDPCRAPIGIRDVLVGGVPVVRDGVQTDARPGKVLRASN
jgi:N-acyl-D-aspartate/D-glutamate deacylase